MGRSRELSGRTHPRSTSRRGDTAPACPARQCFRHDTWQESILGADLNYDFKTDLVFATPGGVRIYRQETPQKFVDVTA